MIGIVPVHQDIDVCFDVCKHPPDDIAFAGMGFIPDNGSGCGCDFNGPVRGLVVVNVNSGIGKRFSKIPDHFSNGLFFIETGNQNRHPIAGRIFIFIHGHAFWISRKNEADITHWIRYAV